ncbi:MAG TPA: hypothetical protein VGG33_27495 [Polyangia bacterium]
MITSRRRLSAGVLALGLLSVACQDLREFSGTWHGAVSADPALAHGFAPAATVTAEVTSISREGIDLQLSLPGNRPARFVPIKRAAGDVLADVQMPGEPLRTFFGFAVETDPAAPGYLAIISLYSDSRMELRLIRGADEAYGVFALRKVPDRPPAP